MGEVDIYGVVFNPGTVPYDRSEFDGGVYLRESIWGCVDGDGEKCPYPCVLFTVCEKPFFELFASHETQ